MEDLEYFRRRYEESLRCAREAADPCSRRVHECFARAYADRIAHLRGAPPSAPASAPAPMPPRQAA